MRNLRELWFDRRGAFAPMTALVLTIVIGFGALTIDMGYNYVMRNRLQVTADSSALAGASQLEFLPDQTLVVAEALDYADRNMDFTTYGNVLVPDDVVVGNWDPSTRAFTAGLDPMNAVRTVTRQEEAGESNPVPAFLGGVAGFSSYDISASSIATWGVGEDLFPSGCIMALNETEEEAFYIFGTASITATDCSIEVASTAECAMYAHGTPTITQVDGDEGEGISVAGTYCQKGTVDIDPPPEEDYSGDINDPYRNSDPCNDLSPAWSQCSAPCDYTDATFDGTDTAPAGVYCGGIKWTGNGTATFEGDYVIREGSLDIGGNVAVDGSAGVGFYLQGTGSTVDFGGTSDVTMTAQNSGTSPLDGFIFFEDQSKDPQESHTLRGTNGGSYEGVLYFSGDVEMKGTADGGLAESDCTVLIADTVYFNGTTGINANSTCSGFDGPPAGVGDMQVRLVN